MDDAANEGLRGKLYADALELIGRLDGNIEELRRVAPSSYANTISELTRAMDTIHRAMSGRHGL